MKSLLVDRILLFLLLLCLSDIANAQIQRSFINQGFEVPELVPAAGESQCFIFADQDNVPGWSTTHSMHAGTGNCTSPPRNTATQRPIELWNDGFSDVPAREGNNIAELNAYEPSRLYQTICMVNGGEVQWKLSHHGRYGVDKMRFLIDSASNTVVETSTNNTGVGSVANCGTGAISSATCNAPVTSGVWADYSGKFVWSGPTALHQFGFESISTSTGGTTGSTGNLLDAISVQQQTYLEFLAAASSANESDNIDSPPSVSVVTGPLSEPLNVRIRVESTSTATLGSDFSTPTGSADFTVTIPAGNYDAGSTTIIPISLPLVDDNITEDNETIVLSLLPSPDYVVSSTSTCGGAPNGTTTLTISDNDIDLATSKSVDTRTPAPGGHAIFTVNYWNNTAQPTTGDTTTHDVTATIKDALPEGFSSFSWTCTSSGLPAPACPAASGSGGIDSSVVLPAGESGAAGGRLIFTIDGVLSENACSPIDNIATIATTTPHAESQSVQPDFVSPTSAGTTNNRASATVDAYCVDLSVQKTAPTKVQEQSEITYSLLISNLGPESSTGAVVTDSPDPSLNCANDAEVSCNGAACPGSPLYFSDLENGITLGTLAPTTPDNSITLSYNCTAPGISMPG